MKYSFPLFLLSISLFASSANSQQSRYDYCMKDAGKVGDIAIAECMKAENQLLSKQIYDELEGISKTPDFQKWNNGTSMFRGRLKTMYDSWVKYRDEYCELFVFSMENNVGSNEYNRQRCVLEMNKAQLEYINIIRPNRITDPE